MTKNESGLDRLVRLAVGVILVALAFWLEASSLTVALYVLGVISLVTSATGFCTLYKIFGIDTSKK